MNPGDCDLESAMGSSRYLPNEGIESRSFSAPQKDGISNLRNSSAGTSSGKTWNNEPTDDPEQGSVATSRQAWASNVRHQETAAPEKSVSDLKAPEILQPTSDIIVRRARRLFWIVLVAGTLTAAMGLWAIDKYAQELPSKLDQGTIIIVTLLIFGTIMGLSFIHVDRAFRTRESILTEEAEKTRTMIASFFPSQFHDRLFRSGDDAVLDVSTRLGKPVEFRNMVRRVSSQFATPLLGEDWSFSDGSDSEHDGAEAPPIAMISPTMPRPQESPVDEPIMRNESTHVECAVSESTTDEKANPGSHDREESSEGQRRVRGLKRTSSMDLTTRSEGGRRFTLEPMSMMQQSFRNLMRTSTDSPVDRAAPPSKHSNARKVRSISSDTSRVELSQDSTHRSSSEPIADLFPNCTVLFADISGFTVWSSSREPTQVFQLLECIYHCFDQIARKRGVYKVETIGDCYLAVTGLPEPQHDHAVRMVTFAKESMSKMREVTRDLESILGPETSSLAMRFGLHSGPVTAGVLRGEKSRFQLFGDTVNTASRMESTGVRNRIQVSQATADLLILNGKQHWIQPREGLVAAKGKGEVQTYWISQKRGPSCDDSVSSIDCSQLFVPDDVNEIRPRTRSSKPTSRNMNGSISPRKGESLLASPLGIERSRHNIRFSEHSTNLWGERLGMVEDNDDSEDFDGFEYEDDDDHDDYGYQQERLIQWNVSILSDFLKEILASRMVPTDKKETDGVDIEHSIVFKGKEGRQPCDEVADILPIQPVLSNRSSEHSTVDRELIKLSANVERQLKDYVTNVALMYREIFFHNFEHASHVLMAAQKFLRQMPIRRRSDDEATNDFSSIIALDPLTCFAVVFAALIHDVDHMGVPNSQLIKEKAHLAELYNNHSIAEQNSLDLSWNLLMSPAYKDLQQAIFADQSELLRFRQFLVNLVLATDCMDEEKIQVQNSVWEKAFGDQSIHTGLNEEELKNLKATMVIEHIIQASDFSYTMEPWQVYRKWNEQFFEEMYVAYQTNRADKDPSIDWYEGQLSLFDNRIIPLAKRLTECKVFGNGWDEFLLCALENKREWEAKGKAIVEQLQEKHSQLL